MPKRDISPGPVEGDERSVHWLTDVAHLPRGRVTVAPGTLGPLLDYGVLTHVAIDDRGVITRLSGPHSWTDHGPRIRDAVRLAVDLEGWQVEPAGA